MINWKEINRDKDSGLWAAYEELIIYLEKEKRKLKMTAE